MLKHYSYNIWFKVCRPLRHRYKLSVNCLLVLNGCYIYNNIVNKSSLSEREQEEAFSRILPKNKVESEARRIVSKLKEVLPPQMFAVALQGKVGGKIIARETISAKRKDVLAPLYGGDYTRKRKLLEKQKKGKSELKQKGKIKIPSDVFLKVFGS